MTLWLVRAGRGGEYESKFLSDKRIYLTWNNLKVDLSQIADWDHLLKALNTCYEGEKQPTIRNWAGQIWAFAKSMEVGDWVVLPSKVRPAIHIGKVLGPYVHQLDAEARFSHYREIDWFVTDIPRSRFDQDILYSFGAFMTVCRISRNEAEERIKRMGRNGWEGQGAKEMPSDNEPSTVADEVELDIERAARDGIAKFIERKFKGHSMARLIEALLKAQGYTTYRSREGPDQGVDILAANEPLGFGSPRLCVQVKTGDSPVDRPTLDQLIGTMQNFGAERGLLVSWGGFKSSVEKAEATQFFRVRLWDQDDVIEELIKAYPRLDEDMRTELPLKSVWTVANPEL